LRFKRHSTSECLTNVHKTFTIVNRIREKSGRVLKMQSISVVSGQKSNYPAIRQTGEDQSEARKNYFIQKQFKVAFQKKQFRIDF